MAIFHAPHTHIGKTTHEPGTAAAHVAYVTREHAASLVLAEHMPTVRREAREWMLAAEVSDRKNARVCDKLTLALPIELDAAQRADLVRDLMERIGGGRIAWLAGIHDWGEDAHNPHAHIVFRDKDRETGKRVFGTTDKGSTERLRELWETVQNEGLERAGSDARVDRRSLAAQGIDRTPGIHVGPAVLAMEERGERPESREQEAPYRDGVRVIDWPEIDQGRTRADRQREIEAANDDERGEREKGTQTGTAGVSLDTMAWAEQEADRRADAQARTQELLDQAKRATGRSQASEPKAAAVSVAATLPEATQRRSCEVEKSAVGSQTPEIEQLAQLEAEARALDAMDRAAADRQAAEDRTAELLTAARRATLAPARAEPEAAPAIVREAPAAAERQRQAEPHPQAFELPTPRPQPTRELTRDERLAAEEAADLAADRARREARERQRQRGTPENDLARALREIAATDQATAQRMGWTPGAHLVAQPDQVPGWQRIAEARQAEEARQQREQAAAHPLAYRPQPQAQDTPRATTGPTYQAEPEKPQARPWTAERGGFEQLAPEQQRQAEASFERWQQQREAAGQTTTWGLSRYVAFVQARDAERQTRPGVEGLIDEGKRRAQQGAAKLRRDLSRDDDDGRELSL